MDSLLKLPRTANTVEQLIDLDHLDNALAIRASYHVNDVILKMKSSSAKKKTQQNDLFAADLILASKFHMLYLSFKIFRREIENK